MSEIKKGFFGCQSWWNLDFNLAKSMYLTEYCVFVFSIHRNHGSTTTQLRLGTSMLNTLFVWLSDAIGKKLERTYNLQSAAHAESWPKPFQPASSGVGWLWMTRCSNGSPRAIHHCSHEAAQRVGSVVSLPHPTHLPISSTWEHSPTLKHNPAALPIFSTLPPPPPPRLWKTNMTFIAETLVDVWYIYLWGVERKTSGAMNGGKDCEAGDERQAVPVQVPIGWQRKADHGGGVVYIR